MNRVGWENTDEGTRQEMTKVWGTDTQSSH